MSKKDNTPAISFFSFQDIITSVTGIMFLVVMLLVLMVLRSPVNAIRQKEMNVSKEIRELEKPLRELRRALAALNGRTEAERKRLEELKKLKLESLPGLKASLIEKLNAADAEIRSLQEETKYLRSQLKQEQKTAETFRTRLDADKSANTALESEIRELVKHIAEEQQLRKKMEKVLRFVWDRQNSRNPVLLVCGETEISANMLRGKTEQVVFDDYAKCLEWCKSQDRNEVYFILLIKPSAFTYAEKFSLELLDAGFQRGREVLPDDKTVIFGELSK